ncbi:MAG: type III toxin-antitoxin system ToxN/AbiQ family toxin [Oscillospiraceae bacterium]|nr:type III toxin-antitoxin system ToxN/AbiQ family toxin [Oscillospiraceae bacterium]MCD8191985.1 type III toxin-antitoxin system ToxN/AbiQ family toxin [Oscillospiraceae bacterium]
MEPIKAVSPTVSGAYKSSESYCEWNLLRAAFHTQPVFLKGIAMKQNRLKLYLIDIKYIRALARVDDRVMSVSPQIHKDTRPFVGIVIICGSKKYCVPLSSPKEKHKTMKNDLDFTKIYDGDKLIGVLNFNNMIPVEDTYTSVLNLRISSTDTQAEQHYKKLAMKQLTFCQQNQEAIVKKANKLYDIITSEKAGGLLKRRCCDFLKLERALEKQLSKQSD